MLRGLGREEAQLDPGLNWRHEAAVLTTLRGPVEEESRRPEVLKKLRREAQSRMGPAGTPAVARAPPRFPERPGKNQLLQTGRAHPHPLGVAHTSPVPK